MEGIIIVIIIVIILTLPASVYCYLKVEVNYL